MELPASVLTQKHTDFAWKLLANPTQRMPETRQNRTAIFLFFFFVVQAIECVSGRNINWALSKHGLFELCFFEDLAHKAVAFYLSCSAL